MGSQGPTNSSLEKLYNFPSEAVFIPALKVGAFTGTAGLLTGAVSAVFRSSPTPTIFALASSIQWFLLGSTFHLTRSSLLHLRSPALDAPPTAHERLYGPYPTPPDRLQASALAGGITGGTIGGLVRGRRNVLPGTVMFAIFGYVGQRVYNGLDARHTEKVAVAAVEEARRKGEGKKEVGFWNKVAGMKWSPMKVLSDEDYANMLKVKLLGVEAQIALVDEEVERLRGEEERMKSKIETSGSEEKSVKK